jgi:hypothetical protein
MVLHLIDQGPAPARMRGALKHSASHSDHSLRERTNVDIAWIGSPEQPLPLSHLLDSFLTEKQYISAAAARVESPAHLPQGLQRLAVRSSESEIWRAWADEAGSLRFIRAKISNIFSRVLSRPALHVFFHDTAGEILESGTWAKRADGGWEPCHMPSSRPGRRSRKQDVAAAAS